ncbi:MAG: hypothetical protein KC900_09985 [Candidatus Omnitrophica bacterium]|nr:hypothetical protein [Candidatus Omnitrophota bacterium]
MVINKYLGLCVLGIVGLVWWLSAVDRTGVETEMTEPPVYLAQVQPIEQGVTAGRNWSELNQEMADLSGQSVRLRGRLIAHLESTLKEAGD